MSPQAFLLVIQQEYKSLRDRDAFIALFEPLAKYVAQHEKTTLAYELSISDKDPHKVIIFERCAAPQDQGAVLTALRSGPHAQRKCSQQAYCWSTWGGRTTLACACMQVH